MALFDAGADQYDQWYETPVGAYADRVEKELLLGLAQPRRGELAVDLGCGTGQIALALAARGQVVTGVDESRAMLAKARKKSEGQGLALTWLVADLGQLPLEEGSFDLAVCNLVLEFVAEPDKALAEAWRVLKPGGRLVVGCIGSQSPWGDLYRAAAKKPGSVFAQARLFTVEDLEKLVPAAPSRKGYALYVGPEEFRDGVQAMELEKKRAQASGEAGAGYWVVVWEKPQ